MAIDSLTNMRAPSNDACAESLAVFHFGQWCKFLQKQTEITPKKIFLMASHSNILQQLLCAEMVQ